MKKATELEWLKWFFQNCDFGPAHGDVIMGMMDQFKNETKKELPDGYSQEDY